MRYDLLSKEHNRLKRKHDQSETAIDGINNQLDEFHKVTGTKSLEFTNLIAEEQKKLQEVEAEKAKLLVGNQDKTEQLLKKTSEDGIIRMSIKSLWQKIAVKTEKKSEIYFIAHKNPPRGSEGTGSGAAAEQDFSNINQTLD